MEQPAAEIVLIDVDKIDPNPFLLRLDHHRNVEQLMNSLKLLGQLSPVRVRHHPRTDGRYQLIFGHRRLEAAKRLGWTTIKAVVVSANDEEMFLTALAENLEADSLTDFEKGLALKRLNQQFGKSYEEIARLIGRSKAYVAQHIAMTDLFNEEQLKNPDVRELLQHLTEGHARVLLRIKDPKDRLAAASLIVKEKLCVKETKKIIDLFWSRKLQSSSETMTSNRSGEPEQEEVKRTINQLFERVNAGYLGILREARDINNFTIVFDFFPHHIDQGESALRRNLDHVTQYEKFWLAAKDIRVKVFGSFAYAICSVEKNFIAGGKKLSTISLATFILLKKEGKWLITHEHWSPTLATANLPTSSLTQLVSR